MLYKVFVYVYLAVIHLYLVSMIPAFIFWDWPSFAEMTVDRRAGIFFGWAGTVGPVMMLLATVREDW